MLKKMNEKKNNKGFSLVELIVVILIMAVLAVALAPQVMRWVGNARLANDKQAADAMVSAVQLALAEEGKTEYNFQIVLSSSGWGAPAKATGTGDPSPSLASLKKILGDNFQNTKLQCTDTSKLTSVTVTASGAGVTVTTTPDSTVFNSIN